MSRKMLVSATWIYVEVFILMLALAFKTPALIMFLLPVVGIVAYRLLKLERVSALMHKS